MQKTLQIQRFHAECCKTQVLGPYHVGGGGGGSEPRTGNIYLLTRHGGKTLERRILATKVIAAWQMMSHIHLA